MSDKPGTLSEVEISFFKPQGFADRWYVDTTDRGLAAATVLSQYNEMHTGALNYITVKLIDRRHLDPRPRLIDPIEASPWKKENLP